MTSSLFHLAGALSCATVFQSIATSSIHSIPPRTLTHPEARLTQELRPGSWGTAASHEWSRATMMTLIAARFHAHPAVSTELTEPPNPTLTKPFEFGSPPDNIHPIIEPWCSCVAGYGCSTHHVGPRVCAATSGGASVLGRTTRGGCGLLQRDGGARPGSLDPGVLFSQVSPYRHGCTRLAHLALHSVLSFD